MHNLNDKICLITGATSGIGKVTAVALAQLGAEVIITSRNAQKSNILIEDIIKTTGNNKVSAMNCDLLSLQSVNDFSEEFKSKYNKLHILINNAGIWENERKLSTDGIEANFAVNHLAPFLLTNKLLDLIKSSAPARIVNVSSSAHRFTGMHFDDLEFSNSWSSNFSYGQSKLCNILFTKQLSKMLANSGVTVNALHPGVVRTNLFDKMIAIKRFFFGMMMITPEKGAKTTIHLATSPDLAHTTGEYFANCKIRKPSAEARKTENAEKLWDVSMEYVRKFL